MTLNGKRDDFTAEDFRVCAKGASMKRGRAEAIVEEVRTVVSRWQDYATESGVPSNRIEKIARTLRTGSDL